jgi:predicted porin
MQKKIIALAVASLASGAALAQTNVTMYGVVDAGYLYSSGNQPGGGTNTFSGLSSGISAGNRIGFKGSEALGNGLKAVFTLEYGLDIDKNEGIGTGGLNARQQFVGLSSDKLGTVALGRQYAPGFYASYYNDALESTDMSIQSNLSVLSGMSITPNSPARYNNSITYTSNNYSALASARSTDSVKKVSRTARATGVSMVLAPTTPMVRSTSTWYTRAVRTS